MKYKLIKPINPKYSTIEQILTNRGIDYNNILHYVKTTDDDINSFMLLREDKLKEGVFKILKAIKNNLDVFMPIDSDNDGYGSGSVFINFLHDIFPTWVEEHLHWEHHQGKQHGLNDCIDKIVENKYPLVICLDSGTNDQQAHKRIVDYGGEVLVIDHHLLEGNESPYATIINNQIGDYPNKEFCGCAVTWQFCRYLNSLLDKKLQVDMNKYLDMVALSLVADMMSLKSIETKHLINKGFMPENIHNPFIYEMWQKNKFKLGNHITGWGAAFYIVPFVNAITRSGTQEEKELIFNSMLTFKAFQMVPSTKRGCKGQEERLVDQAVRTCTNVKNRQTRAQDAGLELLECMIKQRNLLDNKVLLFLLEPGQIDRNIAGLIANKFMAKYQRPCCILTRVEENIEHETYGIIPEGENLSLGSVTLVDKKITYQGSARGCDKVGITNFKQICADSGYVEWTIGHPGAFGASIREENIDNFISTTNEALKNMPNEPLYYVDYIYDGVNVNPQNILDIADMDSYWGKDFEEALIAIKGLKVTNDMVTLMSPDKTPTLKITLPNKISIIKFGSSQEEYEKIVTSGYIEMDIIGKCNKNEWQGYITPQIFMEDYEIVDSQKYYF